MVRRILVILGLVAGVSLVAQAQRPSQDWTQWRGANRDGKASFTPPQSWPEQLTQKWKLEVGTGYATPILVGNRVYVFARQGDNEVMMALDADTGKEVWKNPGYPVLFEMQSAAAPHGKGPKSTPVFSNGRLYTIGMTGTVTAWNAADGKQVWQHPGDPKNMPTFTSHSFSPLIDNGLVFFHLGGNNNGALTAFDANTGAVKWSWKGDGPGYGSPVIFQSGGTRQLVTITEKKLVGVDAATGAELWERPWPAQSVTNSITPVVYGDILIASGTIDPTTAFRTVKKDGKWVLETVWTNEETPMKMTNPVLVGDTLYGMTTRNSGQYFALDAKTGKTLWVSPGRQGNNSAMASAGNVLLSLENDGELVVIKSGTSAFEAVKRYKLSEAETWTQGVYAGNRIFVKDVSVLSLWTVG